MRLIQAMVPSGKREAVAEALREENIDFAMTQETSGREYSDVVFFPVETEEVETVLDKLKKVGVEREGYLVVSDAEAVLSEKLDEKKEKEEEEGESGSGRISRDELQARAEEMVGSNLNYVIFTMVSAVVATAGLLTDSASVVVGSMVIAPLLGPAMASSVGTVVNDEDLFVEGVKSQFLGITVAIASATVFAFVARLAVVPDINIRLLEEVAERANPGALSLAIALGSGVAGALSLTSSLSTALVGVMIAVALVPPAATAGLGIAYFDVSLAVASTVLVLVNVLSINLASLVTLWARGYRPGRWFEEEVARRETLKRIGALIVGVLTLSSFLGVTTINTRDNMAFERKSEEAIDEVVGNRLIGIDYSYETSFILSTPKEVRVTVSGEERGLAQDIQNAIEEKTGREVEVTVVYEDTETET